jgi:late competence protein required for DNA uptake (superfamily II DNA/RNA helicase)
VFIHRRRFHRKDAKFAKKPIKNAIKEGLNKPVIPAQAGIQWLQDQRVTGSPLVAFILVSELRYSPA